MSHWLYASNIVIAVGDASPRDIRQWTSTRTADNFTRSTLKYHLRLLLLYHWHLCSSTTHWLINYN